MMYLNTLSDFLRDSFGEKLYRLSLSCADTCPNRDGTVGTGGCAFCAAGSGSFAQSCGTPVGEQIERAKAVVAQKFRGSRYIAYFQAYTSTHTAPARLESALLEAARRNDVAVVSVATRPDCLGAPVMEILTRAARVKPVWVELGVQTVHDETAARLNRCYPTSLFFSAAEQLAQAGLPVIAHLILGLPGETAAMMAQSVDAVCRAPVSGLKLSRHAARGSVSQRACALLFAGRLRRPALFPAAARPRFGRPAPSDGRRRPPTAALPALERGQKTRPQHPETPFSGKKCRAGQFFSKNLLTMIVIKCIIGTTTQKGR